jgi:hypothetical protein
MEGVAQNLQHMKPVKPQIIQKRADRDIFRQVVWLQIAIPGSVSV